MITDYHIKYFANELRKRCSSDSLEKLTSALMDAQVDLNPHQIEAALFAFRSPLSKGGILADEVLDWLKKLFKTLHRGDELTDVGFTRRMDQIKKGFLSRMRRPPNHKLAKKLARRFKSKAAETYFRFLTDPVVEPTNNGSERAIRHTVIDRRITQGTRGEAGMRWCERIWKTIATCKKQDQNVFEFIHKSLLANWTDKKYPLFL